MTKLIFMCKNQHCIFEAKRDNKFFRVSKKVKNKKIQCVNTLLGENRRDILQLCQLFFMAICRLLPPVPKETKQNTHISKVIALFVSTTVWQSGGDAPYCKTAITACWVLPKLPSGRWAARFPLVPLLPLTSLLHCLSPPLSLHLCLSLPLSVCLSSLVFLTPTCSVYFPLLLSALPLHHHPHSPPVHAPPSRPGSDTETSRSVNIERGMKGDKKSESVRTASYQLCLMICSVLLSLPSLLV